jgi:uncharacterized membrane protein YesL
METINNSNDLFDLQVDASSQLLLGETAKWAKFIAIMHFIGTGIMLFAVLAVLALATTTSVPDNGLMFLGAGVMVSSMILMSVLIVIPNIYLFRFAIKMQAALRNNDHPALVSAFSNMKSCYKFVGITYIVMTTLWVFGIIYDAFR